MMYRMDAGRCNNPIPFSAFMQIPNECTIEGGLSIVDMRLSNEETQDTEAPEQDDSCILHPRLTNGDMGDLLDRDASSAAEPEGDEGLIGTELAPIMGEEIQMDAGCNSAGSSDGNQPKDRGNDISFDIPLISVKYT